MKRRHSKNSIVNRLADIESTAEAIVAHAEAQKPSIEREIQDKRDAFDAKLEADTQAKLHSIRSEMKKNTDRILEEQRLKNRSAIEALIQDFEKNHTKYAENILKQITEV